MLPIINSSAYRFTPLSSAALPALKAKLRDTAIQLALKGTILVSPEGVNIALAGEIPAMAQFKTYLQSLFDMGDVHYNDTYSEHQPFKRLLVKIKNQIIPYPDDRIPLEKNTAPYVTPDALLAWLKNKRDIVLLDTRNQYEVDCGSFENTLTLRLNHFRDFPKEAQQLLQSLQEKTIVTFCTGGVRCEKAAVTLLQQGFKEVYQLKGGILSYFKQCGSQHYQGGCFVFDEREVIYSASTE